VRAVLLVTTTPRKNSEPGLPHRGIGHLEVLLSIWAAWNQSGLVGRPCGLSLTYGTTTRRTEWVLEMNTLEHNKKQVRGVEITNLSGVSLSQAIGYFPNQLFEQEEVEAIALFPDLCPGKSPLPTGCAVRFKRGAQYWREYAISDCGCGMQLLQSSLTIDDFEPRKWDEVGFALQRNKGGLGDLGGGNHFLDAIVAQDDLKLSFLIHTGSRLESGLVDEYVDQPHRFETEFGRVVDWAKQNRDAVRESVAKVFGRLEIIADIPHNTFEFVDDGRVVLRKGSVRANPGSLSILPSSMTGQVAAVTATEAVSECLNSLSHGTGRAVSRGDAKAISAEFDFSQLRSQIYIPQFIQDSSLRSEIPACYRTLDNCLELIAPLVDVARTYDVIAYLGHL